MESDRQEAHALEANGEEPYVEVPAGLLGRAVELLEFCDELINYPNRRSAVGIRSAQESLAATATELQHVLDSAGIVVEPTLRFRPHRHDAR
jgi:hypothetical protein